MIYKEELCLIFCLCLSGVTDTKKFRCANVDLTHPLVLTDLIHRGNIVEAQTKAFVILEEFKDVLSYAGYFQVSKKFDSNLFFWYFPSKSNPSTDPLILWLQGGPGTASIVGLFAENGPFEMKTKFEIRFRTFTWIKRYSVIYIDNPVGTGYSFTTFGGYAENQTIIAQQLYEAMRQFFKLFPDVARNDFYLSGESYGGKYVVKLAELIHKTNTSKKKHKMNLKGLIIGSGFCDPINQMDYGNDLYSLGLVDRIGRDKLNFLGNCIKGFIRNGSWDKAFETFDNLISGDLSNATLYNNITGLNNYYNYLLESGAHDYLSAIDYYINLEDIRSALHVGKLLFNITSPTVEQHLKQDILKSVADIIPNLLSHYKILFYSAQLDILVSYTKVENFLYNLRYTNISNYKEAERRIWRVDDMVAGYAKFWGNLTHVLVRNAGHLIAADQPRFVYDMVQRFTSNFDFCT